MPPEAIRIRIIPRETGQLPHSEPRRNFWATVRGQDADPTVSIASLEAKLCRQFGPTLRRVLLNELNEPLRSLDSELMRPFRHFEDWLFHMRHRERDDDGYQIFGAISRMVEQRQATIRESTALRAAQERLAAAATVSFATRIAGYASLELAVSVGSLSQLAKVFDGEFESFRVFLEAFTGVVFGDIFDTAAADRMEFTVSIPSSIEQQFRAAPVTGDLPSQQSAPPVSLPGAPSQGAARERAEWLWRLANGSLILPVLLALLVMYQGVKMLSDIRSTEYEAIRPVLEHQLKLLEEDRHRFSREAPSPAPAPLIMPPGQNQKSRE